MLAVDCRRPDAGNTQVSLSKPFCD